MFRGEKGTHWYAVQQKLAYTNPNGEGKKKKEKAKSRNETDK